MVKKRGLIFVTAIPARYDFVAKAILVHGDKYDYSCAVYKNNRLIHIGF
jgi:hypothetical protein